MTFALLTLPALAETTQQQVTIDRLRSELARTKSQKDSIRILYDIFDLSPRKDQPKVCDELYNVADRAGDVLAQLDICRQATASVRDDKDLAKIEDAVRKLPVSDEQKETELFLKMKRITLKARNLPEAERQKEITAIIAKYDDGRKKTDKYQRALNLFTLVEYLRNDATGDMLKEYLQRLVEMTTSTEFSLYAIPNIVYAEAANIYSDAGDQQKAVAADRKLQQVIDGLEKKYDALGSEYRSYDISRYVSYRRMLRNFEALAPGEAERIYAKCVKLSESNPDVKKDFDTHARIHAHYYMATEDYTAAIPYLKQLLESDPALALKRQTLEMLVKAAENTGDDETKLYALTEYNAILAELNQLQASEKYKELQIKYDLMDLKERNSALEIENREDEIASTRRIMVFVIVMFIILAAVLAVSLFNWTKYQKNARDMGQIVDNLASERNRIRRSIYYDYADTDDNSIDQSWLERFRKSPKKKYEISTFMTESIVNDLLYISMVGHNDRLKHIHEVSVDRLLRESLSKANENLGEDSGITLNCPEDDFRLNTDKECLTDLLAHVLEEASKCTPAGSNLDLACERMNDGKTCFTICTEAYLPELQDTPRLFNPLVSISDLVDDKKNGLYVCRMIAMLLTCDLRKDSTHPEGTRFIFTVPDNLETC